MRGATFEFEGGYEDYVTELVAEVDPYVAGAQEAFEGLPCERAIVEALQAGRLPDEPYINYNDDVPARLAYLASLPAQRDPFPFAKAAFFEDMTSFPELDASVHQDEYVVAWTKGFHDWLAGNFTLPG